MSFYKKTVRDVNVHGKMCLVRADFNVPLNKDGIIQDSSRIQESLPTLRYLIESGARTMVMSHLGRPNGKIVRGLCMGTVRRRLEELLGQEVKAAGGPNGKNPKIIAESLRMGEVALLENLRFHPGEEANDDQFAEELSRLGQLIVIDAFGAAHRPHASILGVARHIPAVCGLLMEQEIKMLGSVIESNISPSVAVIGGGKVLDKVPFIYALAESFDTVLLGGGILASFRKSTLPDSRTVSEIDDETTVSKRIIEDFGDKIVLPEDVVVAERFEEDAVPKVYKFDSLPDNLSIMDIGPKACQKYGKILSSANRIIWNGPMGVVEWEHFAEGTKKVARAIAERRNAFTVVGGGSTVTCIDELGLTADITHVSTGGGAMLAFISSGTLHGIDVIQNNKD